MSRVVQCIFAIVLATWH